MNSNVNYSQKSLAKNYVYNLLKTLCAVLFPLMTFAYSTRVLGAESFGKAIFAKSFITYFSMIAMLGINQYGTREAAKVRDNKLELSKFSLEILFINLVTTVVAYILLFISILISPKLHSYTILLWINSISIILSGMGMEWLYQALEEYKYIAIRAVLFQIAALLLMIVFVRDRGDVIPFAIVNVISTSGSLIINFFHARKYISLKICQRPEIRKHLGPMLWLFAMAVSIELYTVLDTTMLGFFTNDEAVGLYTAAVKVNRVINSIISALGVVLIPRLSYYVGTKEIDKFRNLVSKGYNYVFLLSVPTAIGLFTLSDEILGLFSGPEFMTAGITMRIIVPIVIFIPFSVMTNQQTLVPLGKEKLILLSTGIGAVTNIVCNRFLIPRYAENGAAIGTIVAEGVVAIVCLINAGRFFNLKEVFGKYYQYWIAALPIFIIGYGAKLLSGNYFIRIVITAITSGLWYAGALWLFKNEYFIEVLTKMTEKIRKM